MGYDAGFRVPDKVRKEVAELLELHGWSFDAEWCMEHGDAFNVCGWDTREITNALAEYQTKGVNEYSFEIPVAELRKLADVYDAVHSNKTGARILACSDLDVQWFIGDNPYDEEFAEPDGIEHDTSEVDAERLAEIKELDERIMRARAVVIDVMDAEKLKAKLETIWRGSYELAMDLIYADKFESLYSLGIILDCLERNGVETVVWWESY
jgi:hypothetical protein